MLPSSAAAPGMAPAPIPFRDAILSHIWPAKAGPSEIAQLLHLEPDFNVRPRNFLILPKDVETAFDSDDLLLLPFREQSPQPRLGVRARLHPDSGVNHALRWANHVPLYLPLEAEGNVPYLRLLAWKAISAIRAAFEGTDECPNFIDLDASLNGDGAVRRVSERYIQGGGKFRRFSSSTHAIGVAAGGGVGPFPGGGLPTASVSASGTLTGQKRKREVDADEEGGGGSVAGQVEDVAGQTHKKPRLGPE